MSLYLPEQKLGSHSAEGASSNKFMLKGRQTGSLHRGHSWVFRAESWDTMQAWVSDIKSLTEKSPQERNAFVRRHARSVSGTSQKAASVSSDGIMDEDDEEPFRATASSVAAQAPKQDVLPRRPQPGGRFPSDLKIDVARGLQAPLSPSSGSSGYGDIRDRDMNVVSGAIPHGSIGEHYAEDSTPTHAAVINQYAQEDGINPYTGEFAVAGAVVGVAGAEVYRQYEEPTTNNNLPAPQQQREDLVVLQSSTIAAPDTFALESELQAAQEATTIAADDVPGPAFVPSTPNFIGVGGTASRDFANDAIPVLPTTVTQTQPIPIPIRTASGAVANGSPPQPMPVAMRNGSVQSISHLHIPGEYPKGSHS